MNLRSIICTAIGILAVVLLLVSTPRAVHLPKGIALPASTKTHSAISPTKVVIYSQVPNANYQLIAQIHAEVAFQETLSKSQQALIQHVKALAAAQGANGVIVQAIVPDNGVQRAYTFIGEAVLLSANGAQSL